MPIIVEKDRRIKLLGYITISGEIEAKTGLHIGGTTDSIDKGGIDSPVIKNPVTNEPYIPGSSLRGRMRSWLEKKTAKRLYEMTDTIWMEIYKESVHKEKSTILAKSSKVCRVFGDSSCKEAVPSVLVVRDALYNEATRRNGKYIQNDLPVTEAKLEIAVDRITGHALPRTIERVPVGAVFTFDLIYKVQTYENGKFLNESTDPEFKSVSDLCEDIGNILDALEAIEEFEGLGGHTSRGSGRVKFTISNVSIRKYGNEQPKLGALPGTSLSEDLKKRIVSNIKEAFTTKTDSGIDVSQFDTFQNTEGMEDSFLS